MNWYCLYKYSIFNPIINFNPNDFWEVEDRIKKIDDNHSLNSIEEEVESLQSIKNKISLYKKTIDKTDFHTRDYINTLLSRIEERLRKLQKRISFMVKKAEINPIFDYKKDFNPEQEVILNISVPKLANDWATQDPFYIERNPKGEEGYEKFKRSYEKNPQSVALPTIGIDSDGNVGFYDGRHRFSYFRDMGLSTMPVIVKKKDYDEIKRRYSV